ncbi:hypothetical protein FRZ44_42370 [Hypericibacter terrae]|uniref:Uncharacterized protein n=1 Tax=Hypericibacter terrae TaxID=2602015 RepID=A0A5J6MVW1_9PROT|nr:hypothetical protein [Hypericibacter terrae]QEX18926.1 hypothetical protein FRZ44_42370 [Hypericibacter terrae]
MTDIPTIFSAPTVRALIGGRKTKTKWLVWQRCPKGAHKPYDDARH